MERIKRAPVEQNPSAHPNIIISNLTYIPQFKSKNVLKLGSYKSNVDNIEELANREVILLVLMSISVSFTLSAISTTSGLNPWKYEPVWLFFLIIQVN